jgi:hypothetical protein
MDKAIRNTILIGTSVIVLGVATYFTVKAIQKQKRKRRDFEESGGGGNTSGTGNISNTDSADNYNPKPDADYLKNKLHGWGIVKDAYPEVRDRLMLLSDAKLLKLNNYYNTKGYKEDGRTLVQELEHEDAWGYDCNWDYCYSNIIKRMKNLGLR